MKYLMLLIAMSFAIPVNAQTMSYPQYLYENTDAQRVFIEGKIHEFFPTKAVAAKMISIANCESTGLLHWLSNGTLRPNTEGSSAAGTFQVLLQYHADQIADMGLNMQNIDDYMTFVRQLYDERGFKPWNPSRWCWERTTVARN